ncbi:hypothetical protein L218DRAFT_967948 [Marasmius fiardii PR-910]|nr:hypothetical protein L218DRAFT_967948 [Marasmius fiardii PR-910]
MSLFPLENYVNSQVFGTAEQIERMTRRCIAGLTGALQVSSYSSNLVTMPPVHSRIREAHRFITCNTFHMITTPFSARHLGFINIICDLIGNRMQTPENHGKLTSGFHPECSSPNHDYKCYLFNTFHGQKSSTSWARWYKNASGRACTPFYKDKALRLDELHCSLCRLFNR